jgi:cation diffusion facilitator family transporter
MDRRVRAGIVSIASAVGLCAAKLAVGVVTGSLGVLSSAFDSLADIFMSAVNLFSIRQSMEPPDAQHPYGHGKIEALATLFQGAVIAYTGVWVLREGYARLVAGRAPESADLGIAVMVGGVVASWAVTTYLRKVGRETGSSVLEADALHFATDVYTNGGILAALVLYRFTGWKWIDPGIALVVGCYILYAAGGLLFEATQELLDRTLPEESVARIVSIIESHRPMVVEYHDLRTRRAGSEAHVDFHIVFCREATVSDAHAVADRLEDEIAAALGKATVVTHVDPCRRECGGPAVCPRDPKG